jgi:cellulose 1,4-beta-cellobiosidase
MMSKRNLIKAVFVRVVVFSVLLVCAARANELCGQWDSIDVMGGEYRINNNVWGETPGEQCITAYPNSTYFSVVHSTHNSSGVAAYPFIYKGCHWGGCTQNSGLPIRVSELTTVPFVWSVDTNSAGGTWNVAYESWFSWAGGTAPDHLEMMIWIDYHGGAGPAGSLQGTVSIGGHSWQVYYVDWSGSAGWQYMAYKITSPVSYVRLDLKDFIDDAIIRGFLDPSSYLDNLEAGFEIWRNGEGLTSNSFSALVNESFSVDFISFADFAAQWRRTDCQGANAWCNGADYPPEDGLVNLYDVKAFVGDWLAE